MNTTKMKKVLAEEANRLTKEYGTKTGTLGSAEFPIKVVPTGVLALDYALGTMGWPLGHPIEIYGPPDIGKSSTLGLPAFRNAQKMGLTTGLIALEPGFDKNWAEKHGVDPELLVVARPNDGLDAFNILFEWVTGDVVDFIIFDSIAATTDPSDTKEGAKKNVGGSSGLITWGMRRILQPVWKNGKGLILINQIRDNMKATMPGAVEPPGGHAVKHASDIRVWLRPASGKGTLYTEKIDGDDVLVGRRLTAHVKRNKMSEGTNIKAQFDFYQRDTEKYGPVGVDVTDDLIATGMRTGVIRRGGAYYYNDMFPDGKVNGKTGVATYFEENPRSLDKIRDGVAKVMLEKAGPIKTGGPNLADFDRAIEEDEGRGDVQVALVH